MGLVIPANYKAKLDVRKTERAIAQIKQRFEIELAMALNLERVSAPIFVRGNTGLNDDLNGVERPVEFDIKATGENAQIVHSLAKWKRLALSKYDYKPGEGLYTDMNAIRRDEELDNLHSIYVDQWDWEKVITREDRNEEYLKATVRGIISAIKNTQKYLCSVYDNLDCFLDEDVFFVTTQELALAYPHLTPKERENKICLEKKIVFLMKIGDKLQDGTVHDGRAPDYDDWSKNGDIIVWNDVLKEAFEVSSMGIRVDEAALIAQLEKSGKNERLALPFHKMLLSGELPLTIGGGIGQSRLCMLLLQKAHIGEVQASIWPDDMAATCINNGIKLL